MCIKGVTIASRAGNGEEQIDTYTEEQLVDDIFKGSLRCRSAVSIITGAAVTLKTTVCHYKIIRITNK